MGTLSRVRTASDVLGIDFIVIDRTSDRDDSDGVVGLAAGFSTLRFDVVHRSEDPVRQAPRLARENRNSVFALVGHLHPQAPLLHLWRSLLSPHD
jgi:hypothetical protein